MNKTLMGYLAVALTAAVAAGGGGGNTEPVSENISSASGTSQTLQINGAGATFPYPIYSKWFSEYNTLHPNVRINYQSIGSGGGIQQISNQTVFFRPPTGPMTNEQLKTAPGPVVHSPTVLGAVVPVYNIPDVTAELKFTGPILA